MLRKRRARARSECAALGAGLQIEGLLARAARVIHRGDQSINADSCASDHYRPPIIVLYPYQYKLILNELHRNPPESDLIE